MRRTITLMAFACFLFSAAKGQEISYGTDLMSRYIWRGLDLSGNSPSIQPWATLSFGNTNHALSIGAWGAFSTAASVNEEADLWLAYTYKEALTLTFTDYFFPGLNTGSRNNYFEYGKDSTGHVFEASLSFNGTEKVPFTLLFAMNIYGNDARKADGSLFLSKYIELGYNSKLGDTDIRIFAGAAIDDPDETTGETGFYLNTKPALTNAGIKLSRKIDITEKFSLPVQFGLSVNPDLDKIYFAFGISL